MCNTIHTDKKSRVRKIKPEGIGWKLFEQSKTIPVKLLSLVALISYDNCSSDGWIGWNSKMQPKEGGFCFFKTKKAAEDALVIWKTYSLCAKNPSLNPFTKKIEYSGGLVTQTERGFVGNLHPIRMGLCKSFKVID